MVLFPTQDPGNINHLLLPHTIFNLISKGEEMILQQCIFSSLYNYVIIGHMITKIGVAIKVNQIYLPFQILITYVKQKKSATFVFHPCLIHLSIPSHNFHNSFISTYNINELICDEVVCWRHASVTAEKLCLQNVLPLGIVYNKSQNPL